MTIPKIKNIERAIIIYYENVELGNKEIKELFSASRGGELCSSKICQLKDLARNQMRESGVLAYNGYNVNTKCAYIAWGIDVEDLEARYKKIKKLLIGVRENENIKSDNRGNGSL